MAETGIVVDPRLRVETWEITTEGTVWVWLMDPREQRYRKQQVGGRAGGSKRLRISTDDRRYNEEQIVEEMVDHNPFRNGALRIVSTEVIPEDVDTRYHFTTEQLVQLLEVRDEQLFRSEVEDITSELVIRRLKDQAEKTGTVGQLAFLTEIIDTRYRLGGTQRTVEEMLAQSDRSGTLLS